LNAQHSSNITLDKSYRISGHESFPCRYTWLPKAVRGLHKNHEIFSDEEQAMVEFGLGKNMVRSARFWGQTTGMICSDRNKSVTDIGNAILGLDGLDPFLEDIRTLWLIHWNLSTEIHTPLLAWDYLFNQWQEPELIPSLVLRALKKEASKFNNGISTTTIEQHFNVFLHTYFPTRGKKGKIQEDNLDCPLIELELIKKVGERESTIGDRESVYVFCREEKPEITPELFTYCLNDFWEKRHAMEATIPFSEVAHGRGSPGQIFKLPEEDVRSRVEILDKSSKGVFLYTESAHLQQIQKKRQTDRLKLLQAVYTNE